METIKELRDMLQREKLEGRERPWGYKTLQRGPSIYITRVLLGTSISPNFLTLLSIAFGIIGCVLLLATDPWQKLLGLGFLYLNLLFDRVDGEVARYRKTYSLKGIFLDEMNHLLIPPIFFLTLAHGLAPLSIFYPQLIFAAGIVSAFAVMTLRILHNIPYQMFVKKYLKQPDIFPFSVETQTTASLRSGFSLSYQLLRIIHQFQDLLLVILLFALAFIVEYFWMPDGFLMPLSSGLLLGYAAFFTLLAAENILKGILTIEGKIQELARGYGRDSETVEQL